MKVYFSCDFKIMFIFERDDKVAAAKQLGVGEATVYRILKKQRIPWKLHDKYRSPMSGNKINWDDKNPTL